MGMSNKKVLYSVLFFGFFVIISSPFFGSMKLSSLDVSDAQKALIFWNLRVCRVITAFFVGSILALSGSVYQSIFRNPLASPYTLGVSSGAACGVTVCMMFSEVFFCAPQIAGVIGALSTIFVISLIGSYLHGEMHIKLLLAGVIFSFFLSSVAMFLQYIGNFSDLFRITKWLLGSVEVVGVRTPVVVGVTSLCLLISVLKHRNALSIISIDPDFARTKGVEVESVVRTLFFVTSCAIGVVVSYCGPIGFIGIAIPFVARIWGGSSLSVHLILSYILGGALLVMCDTFSRVLIAPAEIPVGVLTALIASPFVIYILMREGRAL